MTDSQRLSSLLALIASVITIFTFAVSLPLGGAFEPYPFLSLPVPDGFPLKIILFVLFESACAITFGRLIAFVYRRDLPPPLAWTLSIIGAWTSLYVMEWLFLAELPAQPGQGFFKNERVVYYVIGCTVLITVCWPLYWYWLARELKSTASDIYRALYGFCVQLPSFLIVSAWRIFEVARS